MIKTTVLRTSGSLISLLLLSVMLVSILHLTLFHVHHSDNKGFYTHSCQPAEFSHQKSNQYLTTVNQTEDKPDECLFCLIRANINLTYLAPKLEVQQPVYGKDCLVEVNLAIAEVRLSASIPNRGPPGFSL